jgi:hypothetical protein
MRMPSLSLQQVPVLRLPLGYFILAPWFGVAAGVFLALHGSSAWLSRWTPGMLGATHLLILGCIVMVMMGALVQVLPVISSAAVPTAGRAAPWIRSLLGAGAMTIAFALAQESRPLFYVAGVCLASSLSLYLVPLIFSLSRRVGGGDSILAIRIAVLCLLATVALGVVLIGGHVAPDLVPSFRSWTSVHLGFGLIGWVTLLIMAVSFQVLPMFFVAPDYPRWITLGAPVALLIGLVANSSWLLGTVCSAWAIMTLHVLRLRKRRAPDPVVWFWRLATVLLMIATLVLWFSPGSELTVGVIFVVGFVLTVMIGMLYKIVPFLVFLHLQRACLSQPERFGELPTMHSVIPVSRARRQFFLHGITVVLCVAATRVPAMGPVAATVLAADCAWLGFSIRRGWRCHERMLEQLAPIAPDSSIMSHRDERHSTLPSGPSSKELRKNNFTAPSRSPAPLAALHVPQRVYKHALRRCALPDVLEFRLETVILFLRSS